MKRTIEQPSTAHAPPAKKSPYFIPRAGNPPSPPPGVTAEMCSFDICSKRLTEDDAKKLADHDRTHGLDVQKQYTPIADPPFLSFTSLSTSSSSSATAAAVAAAAASSRFNPGSMEEGGGGIPPLLPTGSATDGLLLQLLISMDDIKTAINNQSKTLTKAINKQSAAITAAINEQTEVLKEHTAAINNHTAAINDQYE
ncbi:hypothetical protein BGZ96_004148 [Linnemannia gamsii]|uniref:C2H2-type domain-containing protein n=1 Tax=Linnemannia gamsii TaxID=64522 RepID=A0ABQ7K7I7_9FUNG|nr:hypothetical protein BGZ96_004148 [Linnemannia gamsii]